MSNEVSCQKRSWSCPNQLVLYHDDVITWKHFPSLLAFCVGNSLVTGEFPAQKPVTRSFEVFFDLRLNQQMSKWKRWWFKTPSRPLWRHCKDCNGSILLKLITKNIIFLISIFFFQVSNEFENVQRVAKFFKSMYWPLHVCANLTRHRYE